MAQPAAPCAWAARGRGLDFDRLALTVSNARSEDERYRHAFSARASAAYRKPTWLGDTPPYPHRPFRSAAPFSSAESIDSEWATESNRSRRLLLPRAPNFSRGSAFFASLRLFYKKFR
ncbi:hypothetical protein MSC49_18300 [Methylosinus sp. C49]|uniref:hypothetical protein n=1 Tax=Methylosinus sp. C49 TaxID=2699395 RepID=UPI0013676165|nr:hypothetical protein [Methylosinus sp. C49]BBU61895.1 hypothetical protein MSC49_18300 [Methylosinus sp. C49]